MSKNTPEERLRVDDQGQNETVGGVGGGERERRERERQRETEKRGESISINGL